MSREKRQQLNGNRMSIVALGVVLSLVGCSELGPDRSVSGAWFGYDGDRKVSLFVSESDGEITGSGRISSPSGDILISSGTRSGDQISLQTVVEYAGGESFGTIEGVRRNGKISARLNGLAFEGDTITLARWP